MKKSLLFLVFCLFSGSISLNAQNLVLNPGFETATVGPPTGTPIPTYPEYIDNWTAVTVDGEFIYEPTLAHSGDGFLSVLQNSSQNLGEPWLNGAGTTATGYDRAAQVIPVSPQTEYNLSFWYQGGNGIRYGYTEGDLIIQVEEVVPEFEEIFADSVFASSGAWQQYSQTFTTGDNTTEIILMFAPKGAANIDVWVDDIVLERVIMSNLQSTDISSDLVLYPNPATAEIIMESSLDLSGFTWQVSNVAGQIQSVSMQQNGKQLIFDTHNLASGMYYILLQDEKRFASLRFSVF
ncbi:MAG: T9SS type A sorting domain-containing protein [Saprospiraceae bacterium]|nr:T9SS type A sorting domain-containing protein [Saprospiraceae bacterium]